MSIDLAPVGGTLEAGEIPVIDLSEDRTEVVRRVGSACREWGFFQIVGHGVDPDLVAALMAETRAFFALPGEAKRQLSRTRDNPWGFYDRELTKNARDKKEVFDVGPDRAGPAGGPFDEATPWPEALPGFEPVVRAYFERCDLLTRDLLEIVLASLGANAAELGDALQPSDSSFLRLNHYPVEDPLGPDSQTAAGLGIHHHTDAGTLTLLLQDAVSGLQVFRDGRWHNVAPLPQAFVINIGDMVQIWSNDLYPAPIHRVRAMDQVARYSVPFFRNPPYASVVAPLASVVGPGGKPRYRPIHWGDYRRRRADGDFADYGAEVQISDYRL